MGGGPVSAAGRGALLSSIQNNKGVGGLRKVADSEKKDRSAALPGTYGDSFCPRVYFVITP